MITSSSRSSRRTATMTQPKQIIYSLRYLRPLISNDHESEAVFEKNFSALLGGDVFVIPLGRARAGLYVLAKLMVTDKRRTVVLSPYTIPDVINMVRFAGGDPIFVDCLENSTNINLEHLTQLVDDHTACVLLTHYHVNQNQLDAIKELCSRRGVACFDDCALALGAEYPEAPIGANSDASVFSLSSFKTLNFLWGGAITTHSVDLARRICAIVDPWPRLKASQYRRQLIKTLKYDLATRPGMFSVIFPILRKKIFMSEVEDVLPVSRIESRYLDATITSRPVLGAIGEWNRKIDGVDAIVRHRRHIAGIYDRHFRWRSVSPETVDQIRSRSGWTNYPIYVAPGIRNHIYRKILAGGFDVGLSLYPNVHETPGFKDIPGRSGNISALVRSVITLPTHARISESYAEQLAHAVNGALNERGLD